MNHFVLQLVLATLMLAVSLGAGLASIKVSRMVSKDGRPSRTSERRLSLLSCLSGGTFLATLFLDLFPDVEENYHAFVKQIDAHWAFPLHYFTVCLGFFLIYFIEEGFIKLAGGHGHAHGTAEIELEDIEEEFSIPMLEEENGNKAEGEAERPDEKVEPTVQLTENSSLLKAVAFTIALSLHSALEGFALGVQESTSGIVTLFISLLLHKAVESFSFGLNIAKGNDNKEVIKQMLAYSAMTPIGSIMGALLQMSPLDVALKMGTVVFIESLAAGTFLYVTFLEVLAHERANDVSSMKQLISILLGFMLIICLQLAMGH